VLAVWGVLHLALYAVKFRILLHHSRYLANEYVILTILGSLSIFIFYRRRPKIEGRFLVAASLVLAVSTLFYWRRVYADNTGHIEKVYIRMAKWIARHTSNEARIAAFDIGVLRYVGNRYTVDLGGLADPEVHPYLERKECGEYIRKKQATNILYSRNLDVDVFTGIHLAEYQGPMLLKQVPLVHFETPQFEAPTLIHSYRLDLKKITGWFSPTPEGILQAFSYDGRPYQPVNGAIDDRLEFVGYSIDQREIEYIPLYPYTVDFTFFFKAVKPLQHIYWVHVAFFDPERDTIMFWMSFMPTHNLLKYYRWPVNRIIQSHHMYFIPVHFTKQKFRIKLAVTDEELLVNPEKYNWLDLGPFENKGNVLHPMDHQQLMALTTN
jgi:hypothetical protein